MRYENLEGKRFGNLKVLNFEGVNKNQKATWLCKCDCGNTKTIIAGNLKNGKSISCGCVQKDILRNNRKTHGKSNTSLYKLFSGIKRRCLNKNDSNFNNYGGRGIEICEEWLNDYDSFYSWANENGYKEGLSIERIDNDKGYNPNNCKWIEMSEQSKNRRCNKYIEINGDIKTISEWARLVGIDRNTISRRLKRGISGENLIKRGRV